jgi:phosphoribosylformylglycinamidine synthase subunit PurQ / glutaminase
MNRPPKVAVVSFPGNNCEVESVRAIRRCRMEAMYFRWNDDRSKLSDVDAYFLPGGFAYEDRGRSGMIAARDPLMEFIAREAEAGKTVIGHCNGAQVLVEGGLVPLGRGLRMSLARNAVRSGDGYKAPGFLNEWVWIKRIGDRNRCATSAWDGMLHMPVGHGEGRFVSEDKDLFAELEKNGQLVFRYCDEQGNVSEDVAVTPNGSTMGVAGICNPAGNVVALMPHPERTLRGDPYFHALREWLTAKHPVQPPTPKMPDTAVASLPDHRTDMVELFIGALIVNNEERTVEQAARRLRPELRLQQWKYLALPAGKVDAALRDLTVFNARKERAFLRRAGTFARWNAETKKEETAVAGDVLNGILLLRRDLPDAGAEAFGAGAETGVCYACSGVDERALDDAALREIFGNPHASVLERIRA